MKAIHINEAGRWELMIDDTLLAHVQGASLIMHSPERQEVVLQPEHSWEGDTNTLGTAMIQVDGEIRMYYRGVCGEKEHRQANCVAISTDGIHFEKPDLGLVEWEGNKRNNMMLLGDYTVLPFLDGNPNNEGSRFKGINTAQWAGMLLDDKGLAQTDFLMGYAPKPAYSEDGFVWETPEKLISNQFIGMAGFDSGNQAFYDTVNGCYRFYARYWMNREMFCAQSYQKLPISDLKDADEKHPLPYSYTRGNMSYTSPDFETWSQPKANVYAPWQPMEQFYTPLVRPIPDAEHILLSLANRFSAARMKDPDHVHPGTNDTVMMTSRDGVYWDRPFMEGWIKGDRDPKNWTQRNHYVVVGMVTTGDDHVFYMNEHYCSETCRMRRLTLPRHRFASLHAPYTGGEVMTEAVVFGEGDLHLNFATSAIGSIQVSVVDPDGFPIKGFTFEACEEKFGNALDEIYTWESRKLSELSGKPVRFVFRIKDADLFAFCVK